ncbi:MAG: response regulator transcription factor [Elusimicrobia bacterium]|nr:response regulator transcription factor [Elusimicrobiota bacterium]
MKINIIFASKDFSRASLLLEMLSRQGYSVVTTHRAREVLGMLSQKTFDLVIIGQNLSDEDGLSFLKNLRSKNRNIPVIAVLESPDTYLDHFPSGITPDNLFPRQASSAASGGLSSGKITHKLAYFQLGADECLSYSQDLHESMARIRAVIRRIVSSQPDETLKMSEIELNLSSYTVKVGRREIVVTAKEFDLLYVFLSSPNRVLSRPYLIERVWGYNYFGSPRTVDVHVRRLRSKLGKASKYVHTVPCVGYKLVPNTK